MTYTPTPAEIEAGAEVLAGKFFLGVSKWPLSRFPDPHQDEFRIKARAVLEAAAIARSEANG
jgi:hypothetical protein